MGIEEKLPSGFVLDTVENVVGYMRKSSVWPATFGLACCAIEMMAVGGPKYDIARFGMERFSATPRQADLMIVAGRVSQKMAPVLRQIYDQMAEPKWVIAMGVCASSGGMFNNYAIVQGVDHVVPVDIYLPGCPPRPGDADQRDPRAAPADPGHAARRQPRQGREGGRGGRARGGPDQPDEGTAGMTGTSGDGPVDDGTREQVADKNAVDKGGEDATPAQQAAAVPQAGAPANHPEAATTAPPAAEVMSTHVAPVSTADVIATGTGMFGVAGSGTRRATAGSRRRS